MANTLITPQTIAKQAWANLQADIVFARLVHRDYDGEFAGKRGDTITVTRPSTFVAKEFNPATGIELQNAAETSFSVSLDHLLDVSFAVSAKELTLDVQDFNVQFIKPATDALVEKVEALLLSLRPQITQSVGTVATGHVWSDPRVLLDARKILRKNKVPLTELYSVVGPNIAAAWLDTSLMTDADKRGDTDGLKEAAIGRKFGFDNYESNAIVGTLEEGLAFHRAALALVARALDKPSSKNADYATFGAEGIGIRVVKDYDIHAKSDVVSLDLLCGVKVLDANRAVAIEQQA